MVGCFVSCKKSCYRSQWSASGSRVSVEYTIDELQASYGDDIHSCADADEVTCGFLKCK